MRKIAFLILIMALILALNVTQFVNLCEIDFYACEQYILYASNNNFPVNMGGATVVKNGSGAIIYTDKNTAKDLLLKLDNISGECVILNNNPFSLKEVATKLNAKIVSEYSVSDGVVYNCFSKNLKDYVAENGNKFNLQIYVSNSKTVVGYPLILHSF